MTAWKPRIEGGQPLSESILEALVVDIQDGRLAQGTRLPTHRALAKTLGVSVATVTRAFKTAERRGLIRGVVGRGTFVSSSAAEEFGILDPKEGEAVDLSLNLPLHALDPDLGPVLRTVASSSQRAQLLRYQNTVGIDRHRAAGAAWAARFGVNVDAKRVVVCAGVQHALVVALATRTKPGDVILAEQLTYPGLITAARLLHLKVVGLEMDREGITTESLEAACKKHHARLLYTVPTIQNPTTITMSVERRGALVEIARQQDLTFLEDDVHHLLTDDPPTPLACLAPERTYFIAGMSKSVTGALRVAFLTVPEEQPLTVVGHRLWATTWMVPPLVAEVAALWIDDGTADRTVARKREEARHRLELAHRCLSEFSVQSGAGAYHVWIDLPSQWDSDSFILEARRRGVLIPPTSAFSTPNHVNNKGVRLSLSSAWDIETLERGLRRVARILASSPGLSNIVV